MQAKIGYKHRPALEYIEALTGRTPTEIVAAALEDWLTENYVETIAQAEFKKGIPGSCSWTPTGRLRQKDTLRQMAANMRMLA
jgi:hypothetical protein